MFQPCTLLYDYGVCVFIFSGPRVDLVDTGSSYRNFGARFAEKMIRTPPAHIAGIGISTRVPDATLNDLAISAGTKALLDAGVTYSDVDQSIACFLDNDVRIPRQCFSIFGMQGAPVTEVDNHSGFSSAVQNIRSGQSNCVLVVGVDRVSWSNRLIVQEADRQVGSLQQEQN